MSINIQARLIDNVSKLAAKHFNREEIRNFCREYNIHFNLRSTKPRMAKEIVKYWLVNNRKDLIEDVVEKSHNYWQNKLDTKDPHKPGYYGMMRDIALHSQKLLIELKMEAGVQDGKTTRL